MLVRLYKFRIDITSGKPNLILPPAQIHIRMDLSASPPNNILRDVMFLDEFDLLVIGTTDGSSPPSWN